MRTRGKSRASLALVEVAREILDEIQPATVRAVCYRLFVAGIIPSMAKTETNKVSRQLVWARENGNIPWEWIVDETREPEHIPSWDSPEDLIKAAVRGYRRNHWQGQPYHVEVWSEKGTVRGTLAPVLDQYGITFRVMHGYTSATAIKGVAELSADIGKPFVALYVGDWDPSGLHMSAIDLPTRVEKYSGYISLERIALTDEPYLEDLPSFPASDKRGDPRYQWFTEYSGTNCWELDAMPPPELRARVTRAVKRCLDTDAWNHSLMVESAEVESLGGFLNAWRDSKSRQASVCPRGQE